MLQLRRVISGGQTGVDQAALRAAKLHGILTGGMMPKGFRTLAGPDHEFALDFGMKEHTSARYDLRTDFNVRTSGATIRFAANFDTPGEICTLNAIVRHHKPHLDINADAVLGVSKVLEFLHDNSVTILNVAGNSEKSSPGMGDRAYRYFCRVFETYACVRWVCRSIAAQAGPTRTEARRKV